MARKAKPWWDARDKVWRVTINGERHNLGPNKKAAETKFHAMMASASPQYRGAVSEVLDDFLAWCYENRAKRTADRYKDFCQDFLDQVGDMPVSDLNTGHITRWLSKRPTWNSTTKHNAITAMVRAFNWARRNLGIQNPIGGMEKPTPKKRTMVVTPEEFEGIIGHYKDGDSFRDLLVVSFDSGCRPFEIKMLEARHVELDKCRAVIPADEAKKGIQRAFYFPTERSLAIISRLVAARPTGPLFVNSHGTPWTGFSIRCRFQRLQKSGKVAKRYCHYAMRHSFVTQKLAAGVDSHVVAKLAGHQNTHMLDRHYSHIADDYRFMLDQARRSIEPAGTGAPKDAVAASRDSD